MRSLLAAVALFCLATLAAHADPIRLSLDGAWNVLADEETHAFVGTVPGVIQTDLLAAGRIKDPFDQGNAMQQAWIDQYTWNYDRIFDVPADVRSRKHVLLRFEGLDTIATIALNGHEVAHTDNMFRTFEFDVGPLLRKEKNDLTVAFAPLGPYIDAFKKDAPHVANAVGPDVANVRKSPFMNGWDFCPRERTAGIYKHVELLAYDDARLRAIRVESIVDPAHAAATLRVTPSIGGDASKVHITVRDGDTVVAESTAPAHDAQLIELPITKPKLWWPRGMGEQPLYTVTAELLDANDKTIDRTSRRVGLRQFELIAKHDGQPMRLLVNGQPFFAKGASWVPADQFLPRVTPRHIRSLVQDAADANMNMLRTWGGGAYEDDAFFDACDELGILVWFDFKFACSVYPGGNPAFVDNVRHEIDDQLDRVGSHPSIAVWCANNECLGAVTGFKMVSQADYDAFFTGVVGGELSKRLPGATFVDGSPGPAGDEHNWWVWHVGADFEKYRESHGFMSEFGFQSFPHPATVDSYTRPADRESVLTPIMRSHQHNGNGKGNEQILDVMRRYFREPRDVESTLWLSQINQAYAMQIGIDHWRGEWPRSTGALVWQLDDCYPGPTWSLIDYYGRRKAAWYAVRRAFAPVAIEVLFDEAKRVATVRISSDLREPMAATLRWSVTDTEGNTLDRSSAPILLGVGTHAIDGPAIDLSSHVGDRARRIVWLEMIDADGGVLARKTLTLVRPKTLELHNPAIQSTVETGDGGTFIVTLTAHAPALWTWADLAGDADARFDDNFIDLPADASRSIRVTPSKPMTLDAVRQALRVRSLFDAFDPTATPTTKP